MKLTKPELELVTAGLLVLLQITTGERGLTSGSFLMRPAFLPRLRELIDKVKEAPR